NRDSIKRGIEYLIRTQNADGSWTEHETTGTGFPKVFYLKYDMYRNAWPLLAFATYQKICKRAIAGNGAVAEPTLPTARPSGTATATTLAVD
ncbi:MAG: hypothetical protein ACTHLW_19100, partial [Verrucomicrobiota bacterium]